MTNETLTLEKVVAPDITLSAVSPEKIGELVQQLEVMASTRKDWIVQTQHIQFTAGEEPGDVRLVVDMGGLTGQVGYPSITKHAHRQIAQAMGVPWDYYTRMLINAPQLLVANLNQWLHTDSKRDGRDGKMYEVRTILGRVRAWLGDSYLNIDNDPLFFHAFDTLKKVDAQIVRADLTETSFYLRALKSDWAIRINRQQEIARTAKGNGLFEGFDDRGGIHKNPVTAPIGDRTGNTGGTMYQASRDPDLMIPGLIIKNSEVGSGSFEVDAAIFRPYCTNTAVFGERVARVHRGKRHDATGLLSDETKKIEAQLIWAEMTDLIKSVFDMNIFQQFVQKLELGTTMRLAQPVEAVDSVAKNYKITDADKQRILNELISEGDATVFGLMQAITATGRDKTNYDDAYALEKLGPQVLTDIVTNPKQQVVELVPVVVR